MVNTANRDSDVSIASNNIKLGIKKSPFPNQKRDFNNCIRRIVQLRLPVGHPYSMWRV